MTELKDTAETVSHNTFQQWRSEHPAGIFLTVESRSKATLHGASCQHLGSTAWPAEQGTGRHSLTKRLKVLDDGPGSLNSWAKRHSLAIHLCQHCVRDGFFNESFFSEVPAEPAEANANANDNADVEAVEGLTREAAYLSYGRNAGLRTAALASARGVCEACFTNFGSLLSGLGAAVLQVHHREQLALRDAPSVTKVGDLAVVCANCHALIHSNRERALSIEQIRGLFADAVAGDQP